ncbi:dethiobiotin synthase [Beijerinckia sp. L45]|uniref:dethiobiotin synthase n=1 Tax=Beijerinckia sp. L45 TaxID=1641855 RepID=UPI00131B5964|nr:dethiobiotin synthase [Beijerinckia sp. L45]
MPGVFVTATGTDAGKTYVSAGLIAACRRTAQHVDALKPVISGFDPANPEGSDTGRLLAALGEPVTPEAIARISPWRFAAPLSPDMAAALEGRTLSFDAIVAACRATLLPDRTTIIEGVGGVMVPLEPGRTILDLMAALAIPVVLVSPTGLGAISHLLTALDVLARRALAPAAIVLSETPGSTVPLKATLATLAGFCRRGDVFVLRRMAPSLQEPVFDAIRARLPDP